MIRPKELRNASIMVAGADHMIVRLVDGRWITVKYDIASLGIDTQEYVEGKGTEHNDWQDDGDPALDEYAKYFEVGETE